MILPGSVWGWPRCVLASAGGGPSVSHQHRIHVAIDVDIDGDEIHGTADDGTRPTEDLLGVVGADRGA